VVQIAAAQRAAADAAAPSGTRPGDAAAARFAGRHPVPCKVVLDDVSAADLSGEAEEAFANAVRTHPGR
jgi:hypothetical protein